MLLFYYPQLFRIYNSGIVIHLQDIVGLQAYVRHTNCTLGILDYEKLES